MSNELYAKYTETFNQFLKNYPTYLDDTISFGTTAQATSLKEMITNVWNIYEISGETEDEFKIFFENTFNEFKDYYLVNVYTPNSQRELARLDYRMQWEDAFRSYIKQLDEKKPVIICGDLNVAHKEIDLKNFKTNHKNAGFTDEERAKMTELLEAGFTDSFRYLYPDKEGIYTWWSYMFKAREKNAGWRIDYFVVSNRLADRISDSLIYTDIMGSDHCPVGLILK